jgi:hypothetical protein
MNTSEQITNQSLKIAVSNDEPIQEMEESSAI